MNETMPRRRWAIEIPLAGSVPEVWYTVCECDCPQNVAAVIRALIDCGGTPPQKIQVRETVYIGG